jgi:hypothetical protein
MLKLISQPDTAGRLGQSKFPKLGTEGSDLKIRASQFNEVEVQDQGTDNITNLCPFLSRALRGVNIR